MALQTAQTKTESADEIEYEAEKAFLNVVSKEPFVENGEIDEFDSIVEALPEVTKSGNLHTGNSGDSNAMTVRDQQQTRTLGEPTVNYSQCSEDRMR